MFPSVVAALFAALLGISALLVGQRNTRQSSPSDQMGAAMASSTPLRSIATQVALPAVAPSQQLFLTEESVTLAASQVSATPEPTGNMNSPILAQLANPLSDTGTDTIQVYATPGASNTTQTWPRSSFGQFIVLSKTTIEELVWLEVQLNDERAVWIPAAEVQFLQGKSLADVPVRGS